MNKIYELFKKAPNKCVGYKQFLKATDEMDVQAVILAEDTDEHLKIEVQNRCKEKKIKLFYALSKEELGRWAKIDVKASVITIFN